MVLGDGARDRGAACELISPDPATGAGVGFVRVEGDPDQCGSAPDGSPTSTSAPWPPRASLNRLRRSDGRRWLHDRGDRLAD
jgi:hypothetical protein